jgi:hypothetical protein
MDLLAQVDPAAIRQPHVQYAEIELVLLGQLQRLRVRSSCRDNVAKVAQRGGDQESNVRIIIDMKNVDSCGVVFLSSHLDQKLGIFVQTFSEASLEIGRVSFAQHMFNPSRTLEGLQMQVPNANRRAVAFDNCSPAIFLAAANNAARGNSPRQAIP